jgi:threonyl-tRNA synthetase
MHAPSERNHQPLSQARLQLAHVLSRAVSELLPGTLLGLGQATDEGAYCDLQPPRPLSPDDFPAIEARARELLASDAPVVYEQLPRDRVLPSFAARQPYLHEYASELLRDPSVNSLWVYRAGELVGLCAGEVPRAQIAQGAWKLRNLAGAYWRGDADNPMLTRLYVWAFESHAELEAERQAHEQAALRDHKKLGRELELFAFDEEIGVGLPLWLPNGTAMRDELEKLMRELEFDAGFERVATPHVARKELYYRTGHLPYYAGGMFPFMQQPDDPDGEVFALRPMNCPHHHKIFAAKKRSYRELPFRISEYGHVYRYEDSGAVSGILRTRCMCMNDAHIYCTREQVVSELHAVLDMHEQVYAVLGLANFRIRLSTRAAAERGSHKFVDDLEGWAQAEAILRGVLDARGIAYFEGPGEAAFYGPKVDFQFRMVTGREETASTLQLDFAMAERLDLSYVGPDGRANRPFILHRAPLGTHERFVSLLIERFGGAFPTWLAPIQARVIPVGEAHEPYAREVLATLRKARVRAELDPADNSLGKRIRRAALLKIPNVLVVGERESNAGTVSLRRYGEGEQSTIALAELRNRLAHAIETRALAG